MSRMDSVNARVVVSKAMPRAEVTSGSEFSSASGDSLAMAIVMPITVPKKPKMGIAHTMIRTVA